MKTLLKIAFTVLLFSALASCTAKTESSGQQDTAKTDTTQVAVEPVDTLTNESDTVTVH